MSVEIFNSPQSSKSLKKNLANLVENVKKNSRLLVNTCLGISAWAFKTSQTGKPKRHLNIALP